MSLRILWCYKIPIFCFNADEEKRMNGTYIISVARKLGCSIFLLPEDILEVNQSMNYIYLLLLKKKSL